MARKTVGTIVWTTEHRSINHISEVRFDQRSVGAAIDFVRNTIAGGGWKPTGQPAVWSKDPDDISTVTMTLEGFTADDEADVVAAAQR